MQNSKYLTAPLATDKMPPGIPYIIGNEAAERFSFYGMRTILVVFMTKYMVNRLGQPDHMSDTDAKAIFHLFVASAYAFPVLGALFADVWFGKYRTIMWLSLVYCAGHAALSFDDTKVGLLTGLALIALGSGGIKPCVSANVGDQFGKQNSHLLEKVYGWFYMSINFGSFVSTLLTPWLLEELPSWLKKIDGINVPDSIGPKVAFGVPGVLMFLATIVFWMGRRKYVHIPAKGIEGVFGALKGGRWKALVKLVPIYVFVAIFWSLYDQTGSAWVLQAEKMNRVWLGHKWLSSQIQAVNPLLILILVPSFSYIAYPAINSVFPLTHLRKISIGLFVTAIAFAIAAYAQQLVDAETEPSIVWQLVAYAVITAAEVMVSVTGLEFSYTQAPKELKSFVMAMWLLTVSLGNAFTAAVNWFIEKSDGTISLEGAKYYWFFTILMAISAMVFVVVAYLYQPQNYIQDEAPTQ